MDQMTDGEVIYEVIVNREDIRKVMHLLDRVLKNWHYPELAAPLKVTVQVADVWPTK